MTGMLLKQSFIALAIVSGTYAAIGPVADIHIINADISPDGFTRSTVLAGTASEATFPGPLITGKKGDRFQLNVIDQLTDPIQLTDTSIHWHGFFQSGSAWADGPVGVSQCPITTGNSFLYEFNVPDQAGTFWYHSHLSTQYCDGLRGAMVVYDPNDPFADMYDVDDESTVITLADWYHLPARQQPTPVPSPDATLINGLGRATNGDATTLAVINVESGKRYRFRIVAISCDPNYIFSIDEHLMTVIEVDGVNHSPVVVDSLQIFAGQRYSVVVTANADLSTGNGNYWVRAKSSAGPTTFDGGLNSAILRYKGAAIADPASTSTISNTLLETSLHPLENPGAPGGSGPADVALNLNIAFGGQFTVNGATFVPPTVPVLLQILSGARLATDLLPAGSVYTLPPNQVVEISIPGGSAGSPHPFHLHGHAFDVVRSAGSSVYNYDNPVRRDVVSAGRAGDNVTIRFRTDNPGPWFLHCHIDWHLELGLAIVFAEDADTVATQPHPAAWDDLCPTFNANT